MKDNKDNKDSHCYDDIINLSRPASRNHPPMPLHERAAQFSPFAALTGHEAAIKEKARLTEEKQELSEDVKALLNEQLTWIKENMGTNIGGEQTITVTFFVPDDRRAGGAYVTYSGIVKKVDTYEHTLVFKDETIIPMDQIRQLKGPMFGKMEAEVSGMKG